MADQTIYAVSSKTDISEAPFTKKDLVYINDNNSSSTYNGQIVIETSSLANSGRWMSLSEAFITVPYIVKYVSSRDITALLTPYQVGLKSGSWQIVHSMSVEVNGTTVIQQTPFTNFYCSYRANTSWSQNDVIKYGSLCSFWPDTAISLSYAPSNAAIGPLDGLGFCNNKIVMSAATVGLINVSANALNDARVASDALSPWHNEGLYRRVLNSYRVGGSSVVNQQTLAQASALGQAIVTQDAVAAAGRSYYHAFLLVLRLKDLHDFFAQIPLCKGLFCKITLNYNTASTTYQFENANPPTFISAFTNTQTYGQTNPYMAVSHNFNQPFPARAVAAMQNISFTYSSFVRTDGTATGDVYGTNCRLYCPLYTMAPEYEAQYISSNPTKDIIYRDIFNYVIYNASAGQQINQLLTNGISSPKALVVIPICAAASVGATQHIEVGGGILIPPYQSVFASEPATPSVVGQLNNFNVQLSGLNVFQSNEVYDYEQFLDQLVSVNAVNGGKTTGLTSGLIGRTEFQKLYRYYVCDLSRGYKADDFIPKSVLLQCSPNAGKNLDLFCFIEYEKKLTLDTVTSSVIQIQ
jgi:hypothetical protein